MPQQFPAPITTVAQAAAAAAGHPETATAAMQQESIVQVEQQPQQPPQKLPEQQQQQQCEGSTAADAGSRSNIDVTADEGGGAVSSSKGAPQEAAAAAAAGAQPADAQDMGPARGLGRIGDESSAQGDDPNKDSNALTAGGLSALQAAAQAVQSPGMSQPADVDAPQVVLPSHWPSASVFVCGVQPDWCTPLGWLHAHLGAADCFLYVVVHIT
jgi:hypothetical protein